MSSLNLKPLLLFSRVQVFQVATVILYTQLEPGFQTMSDYSPVVYETLNAG